MISIKYEDGSTQVVKPATAQFLEEENGKTKLNQDQINTKVRRLVSAIAGVRRFEYYTHNFQLVKKSKPKRP